MKIPDTSETRSRDAARLAYERGKIDGYAEAFADFRRIVSEHGLRSFLERKETLSERTAADTDRRRLADALGRNPNGTIVHLFGNPIETDRRFDDDEVPTDLAM